MSARYTLIVGTKNWSSWSLRPYMALRATGAPFEEVLVVLRQPDSRENILRHTHSGKLPVLRIEEGGRTQTVWDSLAICETLAERHPQAGLWPDDPHLRAEARSYAAEMHSGFPDVRDQLSMNFARRVSPPALRDETKAQVARIVDAWMHALTRHGGAQGFLFGRFSIADCMYAPVCSRFRTYGVELPREAQAYVERIFALPAMKDWAAAAQAEVDAGLPEIY
jgi:glutathione S-transferase